MIFFAESAIEKLKNMPSSFWFNVGIGVAAIIGLIIVIKMASRINKWILLACTFLFFSVVCMQWVYERNEPQCMTPYVDTIAGWGLLPTKQSYYDNQKKDILDDKKKQKEAPKAVVKPAPNTAPAKTNTPPKK